MARSNPHRRRPFRRTGPSNRSPLTPLGSGSAPRIPRGPAGGTSARRDGDGATAPAEPDATDIAPDREQPIDAPATEAQEIDAVATGASQEEAPETFESRTLESEALEPEVSVLDVGTGVPETELTIPEPSTPPDAHITALLGEISELRLSAATHLTVAAAAMDAGRPDIAAELIEAQQRDMARLRIRAEELLGVQGETADEARQSVAHAAAIEESALLASARTPATKSLRRVPQSGHVAVLPRRAEVYRASHWSATGVLLAVAAALVVALVRPLAPHAPAQSPDEISASVVASLDANVSRSYNELRETAKPKTPPTDIELATARLHADLRRLLPLAASDPEAARRVLEVLRAEQRLLADHAPSALAAYLPEAVRIVSQLRALAIPSVLAILPPAGAIVLPPVSTTGGSGPAPDPAQPAAPAGGGGTDTSQAGSSGSSGDTDPPAPPAPVIQLPDPPSVPVPPPAGDSGSSTGGTDSGSTGSGSQTSGDGSDSSPIQVPDQLPAPMVAETSTN